MSNDQLSQLTRAIQAMDKKFETRFGAIDRKFEKIDEKFEAMEKKFVAMDRKFEARFDAMGGKFEARFETMGGKFEAMEKKFDDQFTKLFQYSRKEFDKIHKRLDKTATKDELNTYVNAVDAHIKRTETYHQEMLALGNKADRHERWHHQTADAIGIKLSA